MIELTLEQVWLLRSLADPLGGVLRSTSEEGGPWQFKIGGVVQTAIPQADIAQLAEAGLIVASWPPIAPGLFAYWWPTAAGRKVLEEVQP